jgi:asparagine synthase (glutamine-hydrolysing)
VSSPTTSRIFRRSIGNLNVANRMCQREGTMSIIFGLMKTAGKLVSIQEVEALARTTERYALDGTFIHAQDNLGVGIHASITAERARREHYPAIDVDGNILLFDGRLDNFADLCNRLELESDQIPDTSVVLAAFQRWGENFFSQLIGDWAISLWSSRNRILYLSRDHAGSRTLYFQSSSDGLIWSTYLDTFFAGGRSHSVDAEYAARFLNSQPLGSLTPYKEIRSIRPAHYVAISDKAVITKPYWSCLGRHTLRYRSDADYEQQFFSLFGQSVERRTAPGAPILAELSGGMDSSSIVCMSDHLRDLHGANADILDTVSFYDDSEPNWDERRYFTIIESRRGKTGVHLDQSPARPTFGVPQSSVGAYLFPGPDSSSIANETRFHELVGHRGYRVILSGIGGDELLGGLPLPTPELGDYLVAGEFAKLARQGLQWSLNKRTSLPHLLWDTVASTLDLYRRPHPDKSTIPPWLSRSGRKACADAAHDDQAHERRIGFCPSALYNSNAWWSMLETQPHLTPGLLSRQEYRYPYLDRDLVDFLLQVPREQLIRPGRRRSLMRRALKSIVPEEVLERRRKGYLVRGPLASLQTQRLLIATLFADPLTAACGFIEPVEFRKALDWTLNGKDLKWMRGILKTVKLELWLRANSDNPSERSAGAPAANYSVGPVIANTIAACRSTSCPSICGERVSL